MDTQEMNSFLQKLGFDKSADWMFFNESFQQLFTILKDTVGDENILTDEEVLAWQELKKEKNYLQGDELQNELTELNDIYSGLLNHKNDDIESLKIENQNLIKIRDTYAEITNQMKEIVPVITSEISYLQLSTVNIKKDEDHLYCNSLEKAKELQQLQKHNKLLCDELQECYTKTHIPPLFTFQLPFDPYFLKHDSFLLNLNQFMAENFKFEDEIQPQQQDHVQHQCRLEKILKSLRKSEIDRLEEEVKVVGIRNACEEMKIDKFNFTNLEQLNKETKKLKIINSNNEMDILVDELKLLITQYADQKIEMILYENTKEKYERANKRLENLKILSQIVSDSLSNAELLWILIQLDSEKIKNFFNNTEQLIQEHQKCVKNINSIIHLQQINLPLIMNRIYVEIINEITSKYIKDIQNDSNKDNNNDFSSLTVKQCMQGCETIYNSITNEFNVIIEKRRYQRVLNFISEIENEEEFLLSLFDGPTRKLRLESFRFLEDIYIAKNEISLIEDEIRNAQHDFNKNIIKRMESDKLWKNYLCFWIWFLTDPRKLLSAVEEVRKVASKTFGSGAKTLSGINRR